MTVILVCLLQNESEDAYRQKIKFFEPAASIPSQYQPFLSRDDSGNKPEIWSGFTLQETTIVELLPNENESTGCSDVSECDEIYLTPDESPRQIVEAEAATTGETSCIRFYTK